MEVHGEQKVREYWKEHGNRKTAEHFGVSPWTITHCRKKYMWTRPLEKATNILIAVARGNAHPKDYPYLEFKVTNSKMLVPQAEDIQRQAYYLMKKGTTFIG